MEETFDNCNNLQAAPFGVSLAINVAADGLEVLQTVVLYIVQRSRPPARQRLHPDGHMVMSVPAVSRAAVPVDQRLAGGHEMQDIFIGMPYPFLVTMPLVPAQ